MTDSEDLWRPRNPQQDYGQQHQQEQQAWQPRQYDPNAHQQRLQPPQQPPRPQQDRQWWREEEQRQIRRLPPSYPPPPQYGQQPGWDQPPQQPYQQPYQQPQPAPRRKRAGRKAFGAIVGLIAAVIIIIVASNSGGHTVQTAGTPAAGPTASSPATSAGGTTAASKTATIGSSVTLAGDDSGEQMSVTVVKVITAATPGDEFSDPPSGDRLYAVQFRLRDTGSAAYSDAPDNSGAVVDSTGQSYQAAIDNAAGCQSFGATENIAPGASGLGCIVFEVPEAAKITEVQFTLDSGMGPQTGQWDVG